MTIVISQHGREDREIAVELRTLDTYSHSVLAGGRMGALVTKIQDFLEQVMREEEGRPGR